MENDPLNSCEVEFSLPAPSDLGRPRRAQKEVKFYYTKGMD
jgi:hypothetical protein